MTQALTLTDELVASVDDPAVERACRQLGWPGLRPEQRSVVDAVFSGRDLVAVVSTGSGKSGMFQVPALVRPGCVVVISPLIALMVDQIRFLGEHDVRVFGLHSHCNASQKKAALQAIQTGEVDVIYLSPERLVGLDRRYFSNLEVQLVVVDEAHCHPAGVMVSTPSGPVPVEDLKVGDAVWTSGGLGAVKATGSREVPSSWMRTVVYENGVELDVTGDHPVFLASSGPEYIAALYLQEGDRCRWSASGAPHDVRLVRVSRVQRGRDVGEGKGRTRVFSLDVGGSHDYYASGILVHNCVSEWGHDFRPAYRRVGRMARTLFSDKGQPRPPILALTATATEQVARDIGAVLRLKQDTRLMRWTPDRSNLFYGVVGRAVPVQRMVSKAGLPAIVYGSTRLSVEAAAQDLIRASFKSAAYHAGMGMKARRETQQAFLEGDIDVLTATCAFGMGVDARIRGVVHLEMPSSIESYMQETGRAGRDGEPSMAICRATTDTLGIARSLVDVTWPATRTVDLFWERLRKMAEEVGELPDPGEEISYRMHLPNVKIADWISMNPMVVSSCLRILSIAGNINRKGYYELPVKVTLLDGARDIRGMVKRRVLDVLAHEADLDGTVEGSVQFFETVIGLTKSMAEVLNFEHAIRFTWGQRAPLTELVDLGRSRVDHDLLRAIKKKHYSRIAAAKGFLHTEGCRRDYLLRYFGDETGGSAQGLCCDRCLAKGRA